MKRILWVSNAPWIPSGYGQQTALFVPRLASLGYEMAIACNWGHQGQIMEWNGIRCYPGEQTWGETVSTYAAAHKADLVLVLFDPWKLDPARLPQNTAVWVPIDHSPLSPKAYDILRGLEPIALSRFGEQVMEDRGLTPSYVPHGIDTSIFTPNLAMRDEIRDRFEIPRDAFLVGMVAANASHPLISRKSFPQAFEAFARFLQDHPNSWLYVHAKVNPMLNIGMQMGMPLDELITAITRIVDFPHDHIVFPPPDIWHFGFPDKEMARLYQAFDCLLMPSMGEGFGIPLLEAQACGVPVITSPHSAMKELCGAGWLVEGQNWYDPSSQSFWFDPSIQGIKDALELAYVNGNDQALRQKAVGFARKYDVDLVTHNYWQPTLATL